MFPGPEKPPLQISAGDGATPHERERRDAKPREDVLALQVKRLAKACATLLRSIRHPHSLHAGVLEQSGFALADPQRIIDDMKPRGGIM